MLTSAGRAARCAVFIAACALIGGCAFLPGFGVLETPALYVLPVTDVANRVACELQDYVTREIDKSATPNPKKPKWVLSHEDVNVVLTLQTDESGNVSFTGINAAAFGFSSLAALISASSTNGKVVPTLGAKLSLKRTKAVQITMQVNPVKLPGDKTTNCFDVDIEGPLNSYYLRAWLQNYFKTINFEGIIPPSQSVQTRLAPKQLKMQKVELDTQFVITADLTAGLTPNVLGNGAAFIVPINGLSAEYNPDYSSKVAITMNICLDTDKTCNPPKDNPGQVDADTLKLLKSQCTAYGVLNALLTVKAPRDYLTGSKQTGFHHWQCWKDGKYHDLAGTPGDG